MRVYKNLTARYVKQRQDVLYYSPTKADAHLVHNMLTLPLHSGKSLQEELVERGYDLSTLVFHIKMKKV